jgi:hypothetical protein
MDNGFELLRVVEGLNVLFVVPDQVVVKLNTSGLLLGNHNVPNLKEIVIDS